VTFLHRLSGLLASHRRHPIFLKINHVFSPHRGQRECQKRFQPRMRQISSEINKPEAIRFDQQFNMGLDGRFNMNRSTLFASERIQC
jgi:hypothetical protein